MNVEITAFLDFRQSRKSGFNAINALNNIKFIATIGRTNTDEQTVWPGSAWLLF